MSKNHKRRLKLGFSLAPKSKNSLGLCISLCIVSLICFTFSVRDASGAVSQNVQKVADACFMPFRVAGNVLMAPFSSLDNVARNLQASGPQLTQLEKENAKLKVENAKLKEAVQETRRLEGLLKIKSAFNLKSTAAQIISGTKDGWGSTVIIDKGTDAGLTVGMPVVDQTGVIGQIVSVSAHTSKVRLLSDGSSKVSAMIQPSRALGTLVGSSSGLLHLRNVNSDMNVKVGDQVLTSGLGGVYPKGLPLGRVTSVEKPQGSPYLDIIVQPFGTISSIEEVLVIVGIRDGQLATPIQSEMANLTGKFPSETEERRLAEQKKEKQAAKKTAETQRQAAAENSDGSDQAGA